VKRILPLLLVVACNGDGGKFPVVISVVSDDGKPFANVAVTLGKAPAGSTDEAGHLRARVLGKEGQKVDVSVTVPKGNRLAAPLAPMVLRHLTDLDHGKRPLPVEYTVRLSPLEREYAVLVRVGIAGLPVETFGERRAVTNDKGVASFLYKGSPNDELQVKVVTADRPELRPQSPTASFLLAPRAEAYVVKEHFAVYKAPGAKKKKPVQKGPRRL
jgi:hypothetical protein